jgi:hypothetical protein
MSISLEEELNSVFVVPEREFNGEALAPYTEGSRLLLLQAKTDDDVPLFFVWAFVFLHIQLAKNRKETIRLAWDKDLFRDKVLQWADTKTEAQREQATALVGSILEEASKGIVEPIKTGIQLGND